MLDKGAQHHICGLLARGKNKDRKSGKECEHHDFPPN